MQTIFCYMKNRAMIIPHVKFILRIVLPNINNIHLSHSRSVGDKSENIIGNLWWTGLVYKLPVKTKHSFTA